MRLAGHEPLPERERTGWMCSTRCWVRVHGVSAV